MWRKALAVVLAASLGGTCSLALPEPPKCSGNPKLVGACFTVHGRMREGNGGPPIRIWPIGTDRMLGLWEPTDDTSVAWLPESLYRKMDEDHQIFADFLVCPLTKQTEDKLQIVCVESAARIVRTIIPPSKREW